MIKRFSLACVLLSTMSASAANHYVRQGATGNGSEWTNAYGDLPSALMRGDTYYISDGSYAGHVFNTPISGTILITIKKATAADHGTSTGWQNVYGDGQAVFNSQIEFTSSHWVFDGQTGGGAENNWNQNFGFKIVETDDGSAVIRLGYTGSADDIIISHVDMEGKGSVSGQGGSYSNDGLALYGGTNITISHFWMHGIGRGPFFSSARNLIAEHGWIQSFFGSSEVHSEVASIWSFDGDVGDHTFRYNLITDLRSTGGLMWDNSANPAAHLYVYGNVFYRPEGAVWDQANGVIGGWTTSASSFINAWVYNNTFININQQCLSTFPTVYSGNKAFNNLFYNCQSLDFSRFAEHDYNHFINSGGAHSEAHGTTAASGDPFTDYANLIFTLKSATGAGSSFPTPFNVDPLGNVRGADGTWDRGAAEFVEGSSIRLAPDFGLSSKSRNNTSSVFEILGRRVTSPSKVAGVLLLVPSHKNANPRKAIQIKGEMP